MAIKRREDGASRDVTGPIRGYRKPRARMEQELGSSPG
jgi:hypothetical protein